MKSNVKVSFVKADNFEELQELVNREIEAIQVNVRNTITGVNTVSEGESYITQITYEEAREILNEGLEVDADK